MQSVTPVDSASDCRFLHGDVVRAIEETHGRGRLERPWHTFGEHGIALCIHLDMDQHPLFPIKLSSAAVALGIAALLEREGLRAAVKWPNDVLVNDRKIAGILIERPSMKGPLVVGIEVNVNTGSDEFLHAQLRVPATSMRIEAGRVFDVDSLLSRLLIQIEKVFERFDGKRASDAIKEEWSRFDALTGRQIQIRLMNGRHVEGCYLGITHQGALLLRDAQDTTIEFLAGDVTACR